jgi:HEAT repeat protein
LIGSLDRSSFQNRIAQAAVAAMGNRGDPVFVTPLLQTLRDRPDEFTASGLGSALRTLGRLAGQLDEKGSIRDFLAGFVNDPRERVQSGAISGLGGLADPQAITIVETFESAGRGRVGRAARQALEALRKQTPIVAQEVVEMRKRVTELAEDNKELTKRLDDLEQRLGAKEEKEEEAEEETSEQD